MDRLTSSQTIHTVAFNIPKVLYFRDVRSQKNTPRDETSSGEPCARIVV